MKCKVITPVLSVLVVMSLFMMSGLIYASDIVHTRVVGVLCAKDRINLCQIYFDKNSTNTSGCAANFHRMHLDVSTPNGKSTFAIALSAQAQNKKVNVAGTNSCTAASLEDVNYIMLAPGCSESFNTWGCVP